MALLDPRMVATPENTYTPTRRDVGNLGGGLLSGFLGFPGDVQELARLGGNQAIGLLSKVNPVARAMGGLGGLLQARSGPTSEEVGASLGADPNTGAFMAGTIGAPDPQDVFRHGLLGMTLFHGTPHKFDKFDLSKIGTGEGGASFGAGVNLTVDKDYAKVYRKSDQGRLPDGQAVGGDGFLYEVDVPDESINEMIDWHTPISEQGDSLQEAVSSLGLPKLKSGDRFGKGARLVSDDGKWFMVTDDGARFRLSDKDIDRMYGDDLTGEQIYRRLELALGSDVEVSKYLSSIGIKGTRYNENGKLGVTLFDPDSTINSVKRDGEEVFRKGLLDAGPN